MIDRSDEETGELVKAWMRRHLPAIFAGIVIALGVIYFLDWRKANQRSSDHQLSYQLEQLLNASGTPADAQKAYTDELKNSTSPAGYLAALIMGGVYSAQGDNAQAQSAFEKAASAKDSVVSARGRYELASLQAGEAKYDDALKTLDALKNSAFAGQAQALAGDIYYAQGKMIDALTAYQEAQKNAPSALLELRINQVQTAVNLSKP